MDPSIPREVGNPHDPDADPLETREWIEALDALIAGEGPERATFLLRRLLQHARTRRVPLPQAPHPAPLDPRPRKSSHIPQPR